MASVSGAFGLGRILAFIYNLVILCVEGYGFLHKAPASKIQYLHYSFFEAFCYILLAMPRRHFTTAWRISLVAAFMGLVLLFVVFHASGFFFDRPFPGRPSFSPALKVAVVLLEGLTLLSFPLALVFARSTARAMRELSDRARAMESMNRIDRAVLAGIPRGELLDSVLSAVLEYAPARLIGIAVRDPDGGGFDIVALRHTAAEAPQGVAGGFLPDALVPDRILVRFADLFEIPAQELGGELASRLGVGDGKGLSFVNVPFDAGGLYGGTLFLVRDARTGPQAERLRLLADQAGVAYKHASAREARERNWLAIVRSLTRAVDAKSAWTRGHSERVARLSRALGERLLMTPAELADLEIAAVLHDVGKLAVPEAILDKPGRLEPEEMAVMREHPERGARIVEDVPNYREVRAAILYHHERWDGSGYPAGLSGEAIPIASRIIALPDVYDAITDERPYRRGLGDGEARNVIEESSGSLFDPRLARLFLELPLAVLNARSSV